MLLIYRIVTRIFSIIHTYLLRSRCVKIDIGTVVYIRSSVICTGGGRIYIGKNCTIGRSMIGYHGGMPFYTSLLNDGDNSLIKIGDNCRLNGVYVHAKKSITIGNNCVMASGVNIIDANGHETNSLNRTKGTDIPQEIIIGNNVWVGLNVTILKGTIIGDNSIIAAGSVVKGNFPANSIISSNGDYKITPLKIEK